MELINHSPVPGELFVSDADDDGQGGRLRRATLVAKATFGVGAGGKVDLVDDPLPVFEQEVPTELGLLPRDVLPRQPGRFDVILLAAAHAPSGPTTEHRVRMRVGEVSRELVVTGHREWVQATDQQSIGAPRPFTRMPLIWEHAYGGSAEVWVDDATAVPLSHPLNNLGKGFDVARMAHELGQAWRCPDGFPRHATGRSLPNIESPDARISAWEDDPPPVCWATMPAGLGLRSKPAMDAGPQGATTPVPLSFAHPDWRLSQPPPGTEVLVEGCTPDGRWGFRWPHLPVNVDYELDARSGQLSAEPVQLVLMPESGRFAVTYHCWFQFRPTSTSHRSLRMRVS